MDQRENRFYREPQPSVQQAEPVAWVHEDDPARVISAVQKAGALKDGGASASSVRPYSLAAVLAGAAPSGEPVAWVRFCSDGGIEGPILDADRRMDDVRRKSGAWTALGVITPQPSARQAEATALQAATADHDPDTPMACYADALAEQPAEESRGVDSKRIDLIARAIVDGYKEQYAVTSEQADALRDCIASELESLAAPAAGTGQHPVIGMLIEVARCAFLALDNSEEREGPDGREHVLDAQSFDDLSGALDALDGLPDDQPGVTMGPAQKAEWALRTVAATGAQGLTSADVEHIYKLIEVARMPNAESVADDHNAAVRHLRALAASKEA